MGLVTAPRVTELWGLDEMIHINYSPGNVPNRTGSIKGVAFVMRDTFYFRPFLLLPHCKEDLSWKTIVD